MNSDPVVVDEKGSQPGAGEARPSGVRHGEDAAAAPCERPKGVHAPTRPRFPVVHAAEGAAGSASLAARPQPDPHRCPLWIRRFHGGVVDVDLCLAVLATGRPWKRGGCGPLRAPIRCRPWRTPLLLTASTARSGGSGRSCCTGPGRELKRLTPAQQRQAALRRHPVGRPGAGRARRVRAGPAGPRRRGALPRRPAHRGARGRRRPARRRIAAVLADPRLGESLRRGRRVATSHGLHPDDLADAPDRRAGARGDDAGRRAAPTGSWTAHDFVIDPLPNLLFTRDSSVWIRDASRSPASPCRPGMRETTLTRAIYRHHPRFAGTEHRLRARAEPLEGGDVLLLAPGVVAVGAGRADDAGRASSGSPARCSAAGLAAHRARGADRPGARDHAPGHRLHDGRPSTRW